MNYREFGEVHMNKLAWLSLLLLNFLTDLSVAK